MAPVYTDLGAAFAVNDQSDPHAPVADRFAYGTVRPVAAWLMRATSSCNSSRRLA